MPSFACAQSKRRATTHDKRRRPEGSRRRSRSGLWLEPLGCAASVGGDVLLLGVREAAPQQSAEPAASRVVRVRRLHLCAAQLEQSDQLCRRLEWIRDRAAGAERESGEQTRVRLRDQRWTPRWARAVKSCKAGQRAGIA